MLLKNYQIIIIGAGAAGLMCAIEAGKRGQQVLLLDKASKAGKKILISGGGRCNYTNLYIESSAYLSNNRHFCKSALARYTQWDFSALMTEYGLTGQEKTLGQLFCDQKAPAIVKMLLAECAKYQVTLALAQEISDIKLLDSGFFQIKTATQKIQANSLVIATGGASIPRMGATDFALQIAQQFSIKQISFRPALVPLTFSQDFFKDLAGISFDAIVECHQQSFHESILITHRGLSGPAILQISSYWRKGDSIKINLLPNIEAFSWLNQQQENHPESQLSTILNKKLPKRLVQQFILLKFNNQKLKQINSKQLQKIALFLNQWELMPSGNEGMRTAEVCLGGINTNELSSKTFETKKIKGLYFIGEAVDVTGHLGGYNFQWAWSSGWCAGQYV